MPSNETVVMWSGSSTHRDSLEIICRDIKQVFDKRRDSIFALCSNKEFMDLFTINEQQKKYIPHVKMEEYYNVPSIADIGLAPVVHNKFNDAKSELKCLEYGIWGIPTVCSSAAPYVRFNEISGGANIVTRNNSPKH